VKAKGDNLKVVWAKFSTLSQAVFIAMSLFPDIHVCTTIDFYPVSSSFSLLQLRLPRDQQGDQIGGFYHKLSYFCKIVRIF
jgi:hypothetical protein